MFDNIPDILTAKECQQLLKIGKNSMLRYLKTGEIEGFKIGSRWRIYKFSVIEFLRKRWKKDPPLYCVFRYRGGCFTIDKLSIYAILVIMIHTFIWKDVKSSYILRLLWVKWLNLAFMVRKIIFVMIFKK